VNSPIEYRALLLTNWQTLVSPKRKGEPTGSPVLVGEIQPIVVVADVSGAVPVIDPVIVWLSVHPEFAGVVVNHIEHAAIP
jgi:hypothetical protein